MILDFSFAGEIDVDLLSSECQGKELEIIAISFEYSSISNEVLQYLIEVLPVCRNLTHVNLQDISPDFLKLNKSTVSLFLKYLLQLPSLVQLNLQGCNLTQNLAQEVFNNMTTGIRWINLIDNPRVPQSLLHIIGFRLQSNVTNYRVECEHEEEKQRIENLNDCRTKQISDSLDRQLEFLENMENKSRETLLERQQLLFEEQQREAQELEKNREKAIEKQANFIAKLKKKVKKKKKK